VGKNDSQQQQPQPQPPKGDGKSQQSNVESKTQVKEIPLSAEKTDSASSPATVNKSVPTQNKDESKTSDIDLESNLDNAPFDETPTPDKDGDLNVEGIPNDGDDEDDEAYPDSFARDNNRVDQTQKLPQDLDHEIEGPDNDSSPHMQSVQFEDNPDSNFFTYLCITMFLSILLYILYHNRQKLLALLVEGRRGSRRSRERSRGGSKAAYSKLDCNLEEAITSKKSLSGKSMDIIY
jgi:hypothetical protein